MASSIFQVIDKPLITEKSTLLHESRKYVLKVARDANKAEIKKAVEKFFNVKVEAVNIINMHGVMKTVGRRRVKTHPWKKAIVTLSAGDKIELFESL